MSWLGKIVGGGLGLVLGGPLGAILGATVGHLAIDRREEQARAWRSSHSMDSESAQLLYFTLLFTLLAKVARSDGFVSKDEGQYLLRYLDSLNLSPQQRELAINIFNRAREQSESAAECADQFYQLQRHRPEVIKTLFEQLVQMASIDGWNADKKRVLDQIAAALHIHPLLLLFIYQHYGFFLGEQTFERFQQQYRGQRSPLNQPLQDPYAVLGLSRSASDSDLRTAYRKLVRETHPDSLLSQGVPPEFRQNAEKRFKEVQEAWEQIRKERKLT